MRWHVGSFGIVGVAALLTGCAPRIESGRYLPAAVAPRTAPDSIRIYEHTVPVCDFIELGTVRATPRHGWHSLESMLSRMRQRASEMGGDAIVGVGVRHVLTGGSIDGGVISTSQERVLFGSVVRLSDGCDPDAVRPRGVEPGGG